MEQFADATEQQESGFSSRRSALVLGGAALAGLALSRKAAAQTTTTTPPPTDILNFALNLEYLEAQFYAYALTGAGYQGTVSGAGTAGTVTIKSNPMVPFSTPGLQSFATELAMTEANHVAFLQSTLNTAQAGVAVAMPNIDLMNSFNALAVAAGLGATFDPFASEDNFLIGAFIFEDVGVTAYQGAAPALMGTPYLDPALGIHGVEAYHAGSIRQRIYLRGSAEQMISQKVAMARATLDGSVAAAAMTAPMGDDIGVETTTVNNVQVSTLVDTGVANGKLTNNAMTYARTTAQVLSVVYGGMSGGGAFFPNGMNGSIK